MQLIEPTGNMAEMLDSLQKFYIQDDILKIYCGESIINQNEIYTLHYSTLSEKGMFLNKIIELFYSQRLMPTQDLLYIDTQHNYDIPNEAFVAKCYSPEDLIVQLNAARHILKKNRKIRMIILDSVTHWQSRFKQEQKRRSAKTIPEKVLNYNREMYNVVDELIHSIKSEFSAIIIVMSLQTQINKNQLKCQNEMIICSKRIIDTLNEFQQSTFLFSPALIDLEFYQYIYSKGPKKVMNTLISILEIKGRLKYFFNNGDIIEGDAISSNQ